MQVGDKISFGCYDWRVLDIQNNVALIIRMEYGGGFGRLGALI